MKTILETVRKNVPLVHFITNYVTVNDVANMMLACGGSPIMSDEILDKLMKNRLDLDIHYKRIDKSWTDKLHNLGIKVNVWTCDSAEHAKALIEMGVDFITSNILE